MTELEKIGMEKLESLIIDIMDRSHEKNSERFQHERLFVNSTAKKAFDVCRALYPIENRKP